MIPHTPRLDLNRLVRPAAAIAVAFTLMALLLGAFAPARTARGEPAATTGLQIDKEGPEYVFAGEMMTYTIRVTNTTGSPLNGVVITDTWTHQDYSGTYATSGDVAISSVVYATMPTKYARYLLQPLSPFANGLIQITMTISPALQPRHTAQPIVLGNSVVITTSTPGVSANQDTVDTPIVGPVLQLTKSFTPTNPRPGRLLTYTFRLENKQRSDAIEATGVVITEKLPNNTLFYTAYPPSLATFDPGGNVVRWNLTQTLPVSSVTYLTLTLRVTPTLTWQGITNPPENCGVRAGALPRPIMCTDYVTFVIDDAFEKVTETVSPPAQTGNISRTYMNRVVTYTVYVYNPFSETITGMLITDTLASRELPPLITRTFGYSGLLPIGSAGPPTLTRQGVNTVVWELPPIEGWGVYTFAFRAFVPPQMPLDTNQSEREYRNGIEGGYNGIRLPFNDGGHDQSMKVIVAPQIQTIKSVTPTRQMFGLPVTYTIVVSNAGPTTIRDIQITDTLPTVLNPGAYCAFEWNGSVSGTPPDQILSVDGGTDNLIAWNKGFTLTGYSQVTLAVFRATVIGGPDVTCFNTLEGYSPDTFIVKWTNLAPVRVDVPFRYNKTANPGSVVLGGSIQYSVKEYNIGGIDATMTYFEDRLPPGFYTSPGGSPIYTDFRSLVLPANDLLGAYGYNQTFSVNVITTSEPCDNLPRPILQARNTFGIYITTPLQLRGLWTNSADAAPVTVIPQAQAFKVSSPPNGLPGQVMTFTISLSNNTSLPIGNIKVTDTLPAGFTFLSATPGITPVQTAPDVIWVDQIIPANGKRLITFTVSAPTNVGFYTNRVKAGSVFDPLICIPKHDLTIQIAPGLIEVEKSANPTSVGPLGQFNYNITLRNKGPFTVTLARFTDTLPGVDAAHVWKFVSMLSSNPPATLVSSNPPAWSNLTIAPNQNQNLQFSVRTDAQVGTYPNLIQPGIPLAGYLTATLPAGWVLTTSTSYNGAPVSVVPGVGLFKEVFPETQIAGGTVVYTITLVNVSSQVLAGVRLTDTLPSGFTFEQMVSGLAPDSISPVVIWSLGDVQMGEANKKVLVFRVRIGSGQLSGTYYNRVEATSNINIEPTGDIAPVRVFGLPSLNLSKSVAPGTVIAGREVTYTLTLSNPGIDPVVDARITDTLPVSFSYVAMVSGPDPAFTSPQVVWTNVTVPTGTAQTFVFRALVAPGAPEGVYTNRLDGSSSFVTFPGSGPTAPVNVVAVPTFDLRASKSDGTFTNTVGGTALYTVRYTHTNALGLTAQNVVLTETFAPPDYLIPDAPGWSFAAPGLYTRSLGNLIVGASGFVTFALNISPDIPLEYWAITNTVQIGSSGSVEEPGAIEQPASNNTSTDVDVIRGSDIAVVSMTVAPPTPQQGKPITVVVTFENRGVDATIGPETTVISGWFGADLYVKPAGSPPPTGPGDRYLGACPTITNYCPTTIRWGLYNQIKGYGIEGLVPGETWLVTYVYNLPDGGLKQLYVQADPFWGEFGDPSPNYGSSQRGRITETNEINNIFGPFEIDVRGNIYLPIVLKNR